MSNQEVGKAELLKIRGLDDWDLIMLISEIHDHGWDIARKTLEMMPEGKLNQKGKTENANQTGNKSEDSE